MILQTIEDVVRLIKQFGWRAKIEVYQGGPVEHNLKAKNRRVVINLRPGVDKKKVKDFRGELLRNSSVPIVWEIQPNLKWYQCLLKRRQYEIYL